MPKHKYFPPDRWLRVHSGEHKATPQGSGSTHLSKVAARMYLPFGENFTNDTGGLSSSAWKTEMG
jgi:hypothetical protein